MLRCPNCGVQLQRNFGDSGIFWVCSSCNGRAVGMGPLRRTLPKKFANALWLSAIEGGAEGERRCPACERAMFQSSTGTVVLDVCRSCQIVWFDPREFDAVPVTPPPPRLKLSDEQLEPIARLQAEEIAREWRHRPAELSAEDLLLVPAALGMPVEQEATIVNRLPWVSWGLAAAILLVGGFSLLGPDVVREWGVIPALAFRRGGLTFLTSFFLHAGLFQLLSNVYFLMVFGDNVEDFLGRLNYALLIFVAALVGAGVQAGFSPDRLAPFVGANAGISGIIVFYGLRFPQAKLRYFRLFGWFTMPALAATGFWVATQILAAREQLSGSDEPAALSSLGGAAVGLLFWFLWRRD